MTPAVPKPIKPEAVRLMGKHSVVVKHWRLPGEEKTLCGAAIGDGVVRPPLGRVCPVCSRDALAWDAQAIRERDAWRRWHGDLVPQAVEATIATGNRDT